MNIPSLNGCKNRAEVLFARTQPHLSLALRGHVHADGQKTRTALARDSQAAPTNATQSPLLVRMLNSVSARPLLNAS